MSQPNWFVAAVLPPEAGGQWLAAAASAPQALRRFTPEDLHITVAFLGPCGAVRARAAWAAIEGLVQPPIAIRAGGWRALGPLDRPSAYGLSLSQGHQELAALLQHGGARALAAAGCPAERRAPLPHCTLLRPPRREAAQWREPMARWLASAPLPEAPAVLQKLALYTWAADRRVQLFERVCERVLLPPAWAETPREA